LRIAGILFVCIVISTTSELKLLDTLPADSATESNEVELVKVFDKFPLETESVDTCVPAEKILDALPGMSSMDTEALTPTYQSNIPIDDWLCVPNDGDEDTLTERLA
jgi:hypothetical protein